MHIAPPHTLKQSCFSKGRSLDIIKLPDTAQPCSRAECDRPAIARKLFLAPGTILTHFRLNAAGDLLPTAPNKGTAGIATVPVPFFTVSKIHTGFKKPNLLKFQRILPPFLFLFSLVRKSKIFKYINFKGLFSQTWRNRAFNYASRLCFFFF